MKKSMLTLASAMFIATAMFTACDSPKENLENAQDKAAAANNNLDQANEAYIAEIESYKKETNDRIAANDESIAELKTKVANEKAEAKADYDKKLAELEQKNRDMKQKMADYKADGKENWEVFKTEFSHDMDGLGDAFKNFTVRNSK